MNDRGNAFAALGRLDEAVACYRHAIALMPTLAAAHGNLGNTLRMQGLFDQAIASLRRAAELKPNDPEVFYNLGIALRQQGRLGAAVSCYQQAIGLKGDFAAAHSNMGVALAALGDHAEAAACHGRAIAAQPGVAAYYNNLGNALRELGDLEGAVRCHRQAIELAPDFAAAYGNLGNELQEIGCADEAFSAYEQAVRLEPLRGTFLAMLARTGRLASDSPYVQRMEALLADKGSLPEADRIDLHFALATVYADFQQPDRSLDHLVAGNALKRSLVAYDEAATLAMFDRIRAAFTKERLAEAPEPCTGRPRPIFVVGMPRSGTTLVEHILASHPDVFGAGELLDLPRLAIGLQSAGGAASFPECIGSLPPRALPDVGVAYLHRLHARAPSAACIVDKLPANFLHLGLIQLALPGARVIHVRRDSVDTCLSCFSKLFTGSVPYAYDLAELARYYRAYAALMEHWRNVLRPGLMLEVRYEDVITGLEAQVRRMLAHCGVPWNPGCLSFHKTQRRVRTASTTQVRRPLYASSVGRWRMFESIATPLYHALNDAGFSNPVSP